VIIAIPGDETNALTFEQFGEAGLGAQSTRRPHASRAARRGVSAMRRTRRRYRRTITVRTDETPAHSQNFWVRNLLDLKFWSPVLSKGKRAAAVQPTLVPKYSSPSRRKAREPSAIARRTSRNAFRRRT